MGVFVDNFIRDGKPLREWLMPMASPDPAINRTAREAIEAMFFGRPSVHTDLTTLQDWPDYDQHRQAFARSLHKALASPEFPRKLFVTLLCARFVQSRKDWARLSAEEWDKVNCVQDKIMEGWDSNPDKAIMRLARSSFCRIKSPKSATVLYEALHPRWATLGWIFETLDTELLEDRESLREMLVSESHGHDAGKALERIGSAAAEFIPLLLARLDQATDQRPFDLAYALGAVARQDGETIRRLVHQLQNAPVPIARGAADTLHHVGEESVRHCPDSVPALLKASRNRDLEPASLSALASCARHRIEVMDRLLEAAHAEDVQLRGTAIEAMGIAATFPERAVPVLIDALKTFEEFDGDWGYVGIQGRVVTTLKRYGVAAAPAVPVLLPYIESERCKDEAPDKQIVEFLGELGPKASVALPTLRKLSEKYSDPSDETDYLLVAIRRISNS